MEHDNLVYGLRVLASCRNLNIFNVIGLDYLKSMLFRNDERLLFVVRRFDNGSLSFLQLADQLQDLIAREAGLVYDALFKECSLIQGKNLSSFDRKQNNWNETSLTYGEIDFKSFYQVMTRIESIDNSVPSKFVFYDLGSGTGKAVIAASLTRTFAAFKGIELLESLHTAGTQVLESFTNKFKFTNRHPIVELTCESFLDANWSTGNIIFANSTCFDSTLMAKMSMQAERLSPGSIFVTFTKKLSSSLFEILDKSRYKMSWGPATVYIQRRLNDNRDRCDAPFQLDEWRVRAKAECARLAALKPQEPGTSSSAASVSAAAATTRNQVMSSSSPVLDMGVVVVDHSDTGDVDSSSSCCSSCTTSPSEHDAQLREHCFSSPHDDDNDFTSSNKKKLGDIRYLLYSPGSPSSSTSISSTSTSLNDGQSNDAVSKKKLPLVIYLHGASARGSSTDTLRKTGLCAMLATHIYHSTARFKIENSMSEGEVHATEKSTTSVNSEASLPSIAVSNFVICCPLCPIGREWKDSQVCEVVVQLIDHLVASSEVDTDRVYLTGHSMGGLGAWMLAARNPTKFAAVLPLCGGGSPVYAKLLCHVPFWFCHQENDNVVSILDTNKLVTALHSAGSHVVKYTVYPACDTTNEQRACGIIAASDKQNWMVGHDCWQQFYSDATVWMWMLEQKLSN